MKPVNKQVRAEDLGGLYLAIVPTVHECISMLVWDRIQTKVWEKITVALSWVADWAIDQELS